MSDDEISKLQKKLKVYEEQLKQISAAFHDDRDKLEKFYDIIVDVDSLRHMLKGWKVKFTDIGKKIMILWKIKKF